MGQGAFMTVKNSGSQPAMLFVDNINCMYSNGEQGSNLQSFNAVTLQPNGQVGPIYIEDKGSGFSCFSTDATFNLDVKTLSSVSIGTVSFTESNNCYNATSSNQDLLSAYVSNQSGDQSIISVTITG